jgi:hypothetical protein
VEGKIAVCDMKPSVSVDGYGRFGGKIWSLFLQEFGAHSVDYNTVQHPEHW